MTPRLTLTLTVALAAFIIVIMGALGAYLLRDGVNPPAFASQATASTQAPSVPQQFQDSDGGNSYAVSVDDAAQKSRNLVRVDTLQLPL